MMLTSDQLAADLRWSHFVAPQNSVWLHKKGGTYRVLGHAFSTERGETEVVYVRVEGPNFDPDIDPYIPYTRPTREWTRDRFVEAE